MTSPWASAAALRCTTLLCMLFVTGGAPAAADEPAADFPTRVEGLERRDGLVETWLDRDGARVLLALPAAGDDGLLGRYIYQAYLRRGVGSNPLGLDRTYGGNSQLVAFRRVGPRVVVEAENWRFQARDGTPAEARAVGDSFARSVLWATDVLATAPDGRVLIDLSGFLLRDAIGVAARLGEREQGSFELDGDRSFVEVSESLVFPDNLELEATLTFGSAGPGAELQETTPEPGSVSIVQHHSLVRLPPPGFELRPADPRVGAINHVVYDYASPLAEPLVTRFVRRHRLEKVDPAAPRSPAKEPIVYYLDPGAPEPIRSALLDGARWWAAAFERAGFENAYRVELLPEDAHPLDARYNVITWVHRATRGWSYGASITDPRTGEIIKGYVLLGSQRVRQDRLIFEGLAGRARTGSGSQDDPLVLALARIRQLSAHEVGHTLGIQHNFAASSADRASVMDYPAPWIRIGADGSLDFTSAYAVGIGPWDGFTIEWMYRAFPAATDVAAALDDLLADATPAERLFVTDSHGRGAGTAHPRAAVWDNGSDPVAALAEALAVRAIALRDFGDGRLPDGRAIGQLQRLLVPVYLFHRYQVAAAAKLVGGADYAYRVAGDGGPPVTWVPADRQWAAVDGLLATLDPVALDLADTVLARLAPLSRGFSPDNVTDRELFPSATEPLFDPAAAARAAAAITLDSLLHPARLGRLVEQQRRDPSLPGMEAVVDRLVERVFDAPGGESGRLAELRRLVQQQVIEGLVAVAAAGANPPAVTHRAEAALTALAAELDQRRPRSVQERHEAMLAARIQRFLDRTESAPGLAPAPAVPPGSPIGSGTQPRQGAAARVDGAAAFAEACWHCEGW